MSGLGQVEVEVEVEVKAERETRNDRYIPACIKVFFYIYLFILILNRFAGK